MGISYPDKTNTTGIWKLSEIYKNKVTQGTWKGSTSGGPIGLFGGGSVPSDSNVIQSVNQTTTGNAADFGDLTAATSEATAGANGIRALWAGVGTAIDTILFSTQGNASNFATLGIDPRQYGQCGNNTRTLFHGNGAPAFSDTVEFVEFATLGQKSDFGDLTAGKDREGAASSPTRGVWAGGELSNGSNTNVIEFVEFATTGNAIDFGDLTEGRRYPAGTSSNVRAIYGGGYVSSITDDIDHIQIASKGNATDYGNLSVTRFAPGTMSNNIRGLFGAGVSPSRVNTIDFCNFSSAGDATDFGDLVEVSFAPSGCSPLAGGIDQSFPREPELHSPTGKVVSNGFGQGDIGVYNGGEAPSATNVIEFIQISTIGNSQDFGDLTSSNAIGGAVSSATRYVTIGDYTDTLDTHYLEFRTKGNTALFGDLTVRGWAGAGGSNSTRGINYGRANPDTTGLANETIDYITIASIGNYTDFGNCNVASYFNGGTNSSTRMVKCGGITEGPATITDSMEYVTIGSTGNGTDFGDLSASNGGFSCGNVSNGTRGIFGGGSVNPNNNTPINVIQYITIASTSNTTDFGDLTVARRYSGSSCNSTRGVWAGGENPSNSNTMDYVTIASTGNAADYGDLAINVSRHGGASNGHGGLS